MNPAELLMLDDEPNVDVGHAGHLTDAQRLDAFERMWQKLTEEEKRGLCATVGGRG
jgi:hypothetical protein